MRRPATLAVLRAVLDSMTLLGVDGDRQPAFLNLQPS
jgi:hypothetical protein